MQKTEGEAKGVTNEEMEKRACVYLLPLVYLIQPVDTSP
jgi:hypothetical protein